MRTLYTMIILFFCLAPINASFGQDLVYKPKNPYFGGETFNYQWLLQSAQAQDLTVDTRNAREDESTVDNFAESLNRQLLNQISRELVLNQFSEEGLQDGTYSIGGLQVDVASTLDGLLITIVDTVAGDQTEIIIPYY